CAHGWSPCGILQRSAWSPARHQNGPRSGAHLGTSPALVRSAKAESPKPAIVRGALLFALLHISKIETSPMTVIWLFYAFESLLQTRVGENFSSIVRRLCLLLEATKQQSELLKKNMRALYDIRSAIVHGGFEVK